MTVQIKKPLIVECSQELKYGALGERLETLVAGKTYVALLAIEVEDKRIEWSVQTVELDNWTTIEYLELNRAEIARMAYSYFESFNDAIAHYTKSCNYNRVKTLKI